MSADDSHISLLSTIIQLEQSARHAETVAELGFVMVNETLRLVPYKQAIFWLLKPNGTITIRSVSGTDTPTSNAPLIQDLSRLLKKLIKRLGSEKSRQTLAISPDDLEDKLKDDYQRCELKELLWCPLIPPNQKFLGGIVLTKNAKWNESETILLDRLLDSYAHALWALEKNRGSLINRLIQFVRHKPVKLAILILVIGALFLPVRLSVLAPVEIVPRDPLVVSSPMDGVIKEIHVLPNGPVNDGTLLVSLEDTGFRNEYEVSLKALDVAKAEYAKAVQKSFLDNESRAQIAKLSAEVKLKEAEAAFADEMLQLTRITSEHQGVAVYSDIEDWIGKPVIVGQKLMTVADPARIEAEITLPVADAINLEPGAEIKIFLNTQPDRPIPGLLKQADYEAHVTPTGELAFGIRASLTQETGARIGLRGTAKIYGARVSLFYYLFRRPLTLMRVTIGL